MISVQFTRPVHESGPRRAVSSRRVPLLLLLALAGLPGSGELHAQAASGEARLTLLAGGDIEWALNLQRPQIYHHPAAEGWRSVPYLLTEERRAWMRVHEPELLASIDSHYERSIKYGLEFESDLEMGRHPFQRIRDLIRSADISFVNLETPITDRARRAYDAALVSPPSFADGIAWAGITAVSVANNHAFDAEGEGLIHTLEILDQVGVRRAGGGRNLEEARRPVILERNGIRVAILAYAQFVNPGQRVTAFALPDLSGVAPMDPFLIEEDIRRVRDQVDHVILSFHWSGGGSNDSSTKVDPHPEGIAFAHRMIDAGADMILGHHAPLPRGIEIYRGKPIVYSLGKLIFGHNHETWTDQMMVRFSLSASGVEEIEILPIAGEGMDMAQPYVLQGPRAQAILETVRERSARLGTEVEIRGDVAVVRIP